MQIIVPISFPCFIYAPVCTLDFAPISDFLRVYACLCYACELREATSRVGEMSCNSGTPHVRVSRAPRPNEVSAVVFVSLRVFSFVGLLPCPCLSSAYLLFLQTSQSRFPPFCTRPPRSRAVAASLRLFCPILTFPTVFWACTSAISAFHAIFRVS